jgi:hypothetical protein
MSLLWTKMFHTSPLRNLLRACLLLGGIALAGPAAHAQAPPDPANAPIPTRKKPPKPPPVNMVVEVGRENRARRDRISPIRVVLDNNDRALKGRLEVRDFRGNVTETPVELPRQAHKEYLLFALLSTDSDHPQAASAEILLLEGRRVVARQTLAPKYPDEVLVLSATGDGSGLQFLSEQGKYRLPGEGRGFLVSHVSPRDLPRQWPGYEPADVVALNGRAWTEMDDTQRRAFRIWVERGGHAILCGESTMEWRDPEAQALAGVIPRKLVSLRSLDCVAPWGGLPYQARAGALLTVSGPLTPGSTPVFRDSASEHEDALIVTRAAFLGRVLWIGFDPFRETLRDWDGYAGFWRRALRHAMMNPDTPPVIPPLDQSEEARAAASALPRLPAPPLAAILVFGVFYAIIFGPVNIWVLRRLRRTVRSWLFTPALALGMTLVALGVGQSWGNARTVVSSLSLLLATDGSRSALEQNLTGLFSPTNRAFDLVQDDPAPGLHDRGPADPQDPGPAMDLGWPDHQKDGVATWDQVALQLYSTRLLDLTRPRDLAGSMDLRLRVDRASGAVTVAGIVRNGTNLLLKDAYLTCSGRYYWLGDLSPGDQQDVETRGWSRAFPQRAVAAAPVGELQENQSFRENVQKLWRDARTLLIPQSSSSVWLVARCADYRGGLEVAGLSYNNRAGLLLVQDR